MIRLPLLFLHGIRGSRLAIKGENEPLIIWELANEVHPLGHLLALLHDGIGPPRSGDPAQPVFPLDLEPEVYGTFLTWASARGVLHAPAWDWRLAPGMVAKSLANQLPEGPCDVVIHSMGLHVLGELVTSGALPMGRIRRLVLAAPAFGGALDILHVLLSGCDRECDGGDATGHSFGHLVRSMPSLYRLLPVPGFGQLLDSDGREIDPLWPEFWPVDALGDGERHRRTLEFLLTGARRDREHLLSFAHCLRDLGPRLLIVAGQGQATPIRCRLQSSSLACLAANLEMGVAGDGRLALRAQQPLGERLAMEIFGDDEHPLAHGDILRSPVVLERLTQFLS